MLQWNTHKVELFQLSGQIIFVQVILGIVTAIMCFEYKKTSMYEYVRSWANPIAFGSNKMKRYPHENVLFNASLWERKRQLILRKQWQNRENWKLSSREKWWVLSEQRLDCLLIWLIRFKQRISILRYDYLFGTENHGRLLLIWIG